MLKPRQTIVALLFWPAFAGAALSNESPNAVYIGKISPLGEFGVFELVAEPGVNTSSLYRKYFRLWGVNISSEALANFVGQETYGCEQVGTVQTMTVGPIIVVECGSGCVDELSKTLLDEGIAQPFCVEFNYDAVCR